MSSSGWDHMAEWWDYRPGEEGDHWHRALIDPPLLRLVGEVSGKGVLDLTCGNGYLSRRFARQGATVIGVDASVPLIERGKPQRGTGTPRYYLS
jgi:2-polyprenyl-3-methyl-5-hydroxy-6-metoxy-1,4-benzoquinol methylase